MTQITNDNDFRKAIESLDFDKQRVVAGLFVKNVIGLCDDERVSRVIDIATNASASGDELASALKTARAATAAVTPQSQSKGGGPAWQAAMSSRMARTSKQIDTEDVATSDESEQQYKILSDYLNS